MTQVQSQAALPKLGSFSSREIYILAGLMVPTAMSLIDAGMLAVALPVIQTEFAISIELLAWAVAAAHISRVALMPIYGRLGDRLGKRRLYLVGLVIFALGAVVGIFAPSYPWLLAGRLLQGVGSASFPLAVALIVDVFPPERRGRAIGLWNAAAPIGIMLGPVIGGLVVEALGWHAIFVIVVMTALASFGIVVGLIPSPQQAPAQGSFDWLGAISLALLVTSLLLATTTAGLIPFGSALNLAFWGVSGATLLALIWNSRRLSDPFIRFKVLWNRRFLLPALTVNLRMFAHDGARFLMVLYLANVFGQSPKTIGLFMLFYTLPLLIGITYGGFLADRWSGRVLGAGGMFVLAAGLLGVGLIDPSAGAVMLAPPLIIAGLGGGICLVSFTKEAVVALGDEHVGLASGLYNMLRFAGSAAASPLLSLVLASGFAQYGGLETVSFPYQLSFLVVAAVALLGAGVAATIPDME